MPAAPDHLQRDFTAAAPNRRLVSDITSVRTGQGWLHLAIVLDLFSRRIVGWAMHATLSQALVRDALAMAFRDRRLAAGLLVHSDRGGQYLSATVQGLLDEHGAVPSTSRPGACLDNAVAESFFHTLKTELVYPAVPDARGGPSGDLRLQRRLLQPVASPLERGLPLAQGVRSAVCRPLT